MQLSDPISSRLRNHYASNEIKDKLLELTNQRNTMLHRWEERWEHLQLILEVYQFARDAAVAEAWLIAQDPYLKSEELGVSSLFSLAKEQNVDLFSLLLSTQSTKWRTSSRSTRPLRRRPRRRRRGSRLWSA